MKKDGHDALRHIRAEYARLRQQEGCQPPDIDCIVCVSAADEQLEKGGENDAYQLGLNCFVLGYTSDIAEKVINATFCNVAQKKMFWAGWNAEQDYSKTNQIIEGFAKTIFYSDTELAVDKKTEEFLRQSFKK